MGEAEIVEDLDAWLAACARHQIVAAALRKTCEIRPEAGDGYSVTVAPVSYVTLVGYRAGHMVKLRLEADPRALRAALEGRGMRVREVWDNLG